MYFYHALKFGAAKAIMRINKTNLKEKTNSYEFSHFIYADTLALYIEFYIAMIMQMMEGVIIFPLFIQNEPKQFSYTWVNRN